MRLYLDASAIIYGVESNIALRRRVATWIRQALADETNGLLITSALSTLECRVKPLRDGSEPLLSRYDDIFKYRRLRVVDIGPAVLAKAAELRAQLGFKTPDAIHLATALVDNADTFLTGDGSLKRCRGLNVVILDAG